MNLNLIILMLLAGFAGRAASRTPEFAAGRAYYAAGQFKKAVAHFRLALMVNPGDAEACYWTGISYQALADIATPFGGKNNSNARDYLTRAMQLAPGQPEYRRALFDFLLDSSDSSRTALRQAAGILSTVTESDPDYAEMRRRLDDQRKVNSSVEVRLGRLFLTVPRAAYRVAALPASALPARSDVASWPSEGQ
jgi:tetratricopeptide (TPR) repeat protein